jgi:hypothetical protein
MVDCRQVNSTRSPFSAIPGRCRLLTTINNFPMLTPASQVFLLFANTVEEVAVLAEEGLAW